MTSDDKAISALTWIWRAVKGWSPQTLGVLATGFSIVWASYSDRIWEDGVWAAWVTGGLLLSALIAQIFVQRPSYMRLAKNLRETEIQADADRTRLRGDAEAKARIIADSMKILLRKIAEHCNVDSNNDRVSVYYYYEEKFVLLARYAMHPDYVKPGRTEYPISQGAIGAAWDIGSIVTSLPATRKRWEQNLVSKHGYSPDEASNLRMQCVEIAALRIEVDHRAVGVIVFESTEQDTVTQETIDTARDSMLFATLEEFVSAAAMHTPRGAQLVGPQPAPPQRSTPPWKAGKAAA